MLVVFRPPTYGDPPRRGTSRHGFGVLTDITLMM
jgi:hypothetical protein